jgi:hypothetical protein
VLGKNLFLGPAENRIGGYGVTENSFRDMTYGVLVFGKWPQPAIIRNNTFVNIFSAVEVWGMVAHVQDNDFSAPDWERIPVFPGPIAAFSFNSAEFPFISTGPCKHNLAAGNRVEGYVDPVTLFVLGTGAPCRHNVVRDNLIVDSREYTPGNGAGPIYYYNGTDDVSLLSHNLIQGNRIHGSFGNGVIILFGEHNRIVNNVITDIQMTFPFQGWLGESNGSGVWVSPGGQQNRILNNHFADVEAEEVILEADNNHVATTSANDVVRDLGIGNRITGPGSVVTTAAPGSVDAGAARAAAERAGAPEMLRERFGARGRMLEEGMRVEPPR